MLITTDNELPFIGHYQTLVIKFCNWHQSSFHSLEQGLITCDCFIVLNLVTIAVAKWDEEFSASAKMGSKSVGTSSIGYVADEW